MTKPVDIYIGYDTKEIVSRPLPEHSGQELSAGYAF